MNCGFSIVWISLWSTEKNAAGGAGINSRIATALRNSGVDGITLGDHLWDERGFEREIDSLDWLCRPANLPESNPGLNSLLLEKGDLKLGVVTVLGRQFMRVHPSCPLKLLANTLNL